MAVPAALQLPRGDVPQLQRSGDVAGQRRVPSGEMATEEIDQSWPLSTCSDRLLLEVPHDDRPAWWTLMARCRRAIRRAVGAAMLGGEKTCSTAPSATDRSTISPSSPAVSTCAPPGRNSAVRAMSLCTPRSRSHRLSVEVPHLMVRSVPALTSVLPSGETSARRRHRGGLRAGSPAASGRRQRRRGHPRRQPVPGGASATAGGCVSAPASAPCTCVPAFPASSVAPAPPCGGDAAASSIGFGGVSGAGAGGAVCSGAGGALAMSSAGGAAGAGSGAGSLLVRPSPSALSGDGVCQGPKRSATRTRIAMNGTTTRNRRRRGLAAGPCHHVAAEQGRFARRVLPRPVRAAAPEPQGCDRTENACRQENRQSRKGQPARPRVEICRRRQDPRRSARNTAWRSRAGR